VFGPVSSQLELSAADREWCGGRSVAGLLAWRDVFEPRSVHVGSVVNKLALGLGFLAYCVFPVCIIPPLPHTVYNNITVMGLVSSVGIATCYVPDGPGIESGRGEIFRTHPDQSWGRPSLLYNGYRVFLWDNSARA
jgi:hypothetical protein